MPRLDRSAPKPMFGTKLLFVLQDNPSRGLDSHQGQVILADGETGQLRALLDASAVTAIRTAAVSALATRLLARDDASVLAIIGTGIQARKHLESIPLVRRITRVLVAGSTPDRARAFVNEAGTAAPCPIVVAESAEAAVREADIVVTVTDSPTPVIAREWLRPGTHVNAVGASRPMQWEIDPRILWQRRCLYRSARVALCRGGRLPSRRRRRTHRGDGSDRRARRADHRKEERTNVGRSDHAISIAGVGASKTWLPRNISSEKWDGPLQ